MSISHIKMEISMKGKSKIGSFMEKERSFMQMAPFMMDNGRTEYNMGMVYSCNLATSGMKVVGLMERCMVTVSSRMLMDHLI